MTAKENRAIEPDSLNEAARLLFDLAETISEQFTGVHDGLAAAADKNTEVLPASTAAFAMLDERWSGYEHKDMRENATTFAEYLAVFAADAQAIDEYTAADFQRLADAALFGTEMRASAVDVDSASLAYDGPR